HKGRISSKEGQTHTCLAFQSRLNWPLIYIPGQLFTNVVVILRCDLNHIGRDHGKAVLVSSEDRTHEPLQIAKGLCAAQMFMVCCQLSLDIRSHFRPPGHYRNTFLNGIDPDSNTLSRRGNDSLERV